jgi:hypothetical protein
MVANVARGPPAFASTVTDTRRKEAAGSFENTRRRVTKDRKLDPPLSDDTKRHIKIENPYREHVKEFYI